MKISGVIITYNEARNIARCLASLQDVCDEILVLDSFSNDSTQQICHSFGVRFEQNSFEGHIQQKNEALQRASHPWVLSLDADEALSPELRSSILALKKQGLQKGGFTFNRLTNYCGKWIHHSGWYPDTKLRLVTKADAKWGGINPHDQLQTSSELPIQHLKGDLLHYSYYTKADHFKQIAYFSEIASKELYARRVRSSLPKIVMKVLAQFIKTYVVKLGFLDGIAGWHIAVRSAYATQQKYQMLRKRWQNG
jgi:glycosyltransferase involved in cell wall biosynthesis